MIIYYIKKAYDKYRQDGIISLIYSVSNILAKNILTTEERVKLNTIRNKYINRIRHEAPPNPTKVIYIDARSIDKRIKEGMSRDHGLGQVKRGEWSDKKESIYKTPIFQGMYERFQNNKDWRETVIYKDAIEKFEDREDLRGARNIKDFVNNRCSYVDRLYEDVKKNGYKKASASESDTERFRNDYTDKLEVLVIIGPNGEIFLRDGQHRFAIAHMLNLEIPVQVLCRHGQWQEIRDEIYANGLTKKYEHLRNHPDIQDILD